MALYDKEQIEKQKKQTQKLDKIIIVAIVLIVIMMIVVGGVAFYLINNPNVVTIYLDGTENIDLEEIIEVYTLEDGSTEIKAPIKEIASYFGYSSYNGIYGEVASEDTDSCYVESEDEVASFELGSNIITKLDLTNSSATYINYEIDNEITKENDVLYTTSAGLEEAFNIYISYNEKTKELNIYTLEELVTDATSIATKYSSSASIDETLDNYKAILDGMIVIKDDGKYGVLDFNTGKELMETKYDDITYIPQNGLFMIESSNKVGIYSSEGEAKVSPSYDSLVLIDDENNLYIAEQDDLYGIINLEEEIIVYIEYDEIGIDIDDFDQDDVTTGYILLDTLIPIKQDNKWAFFNKRGKQMTDFIYDEIGCKTSNKSSTTHNVLIVENDDGEAIALVVKRENDSGEEKYTFIDDDGEEILGCIIDDVYYKISSGVGTYYMTRDDSVFEVLDYID